MDWVDAIDKSDQRDGSFASWEEPASRLKSKRARWNRKGIGPDVVLIDDHLPFQGSSF